MPTGSKVEVRPGVWRLRVVRGYKPNGAPIQINRTVTGTSKDAGKALAKLVSQIDDGTVATSGAMTFEAYLVERYLPHIESRLGVETYRNHHSRIHKRIIPTLGRKRLDRLTAMDLDAAYGDWLSEGLQASTVHAHHLVISAALNQAVKWDLISRAVTKQATPPRAFRRQATLPTIEQIKHMIDLAVETDPVLSVAIMLAALTGARRGELLALRWSDIDRSAMTVTIGRSVKRGASGQRVVGETKTHTVRKLAIDELTLAVFDTHRKYREGLTDDALAGMPDDGYIITWDDPTGGMPANPDVLSNRFARLAEAGGCPEVRFHDLRHALATTLLAEGYDLAIVAGRLGHSSPVVTLRVYAHALAARDRQAAGVMGALLSST
jgi:integrase